MYYLLIAYYSISEENKFSLRQENIEKNIRDFYFSSQIIKVTTKYRNIELPRHITRFPRGKPPAHCLMNGTRSSLSLSLSLSLSIHVIVSSGLYLFFTRVPQSTR